MADDFDPAAFVAKARPSSSDDFDPAAFVAKAASAPVAPAHHLEAARPTVGPIETFVRNAYDIVPGSRQLKDALATVAYGLGRGGGVKYGPEMLKAGAKQESAPGVLDAYRGTRAYEQQRDQAGTEDNPNAALAGTGTKLALTLLAPLPKVASGLGKYGTLGRISSGALTTAAYGAANSLANGNADLSRGEFGQAGLDALGTEGMRQAYDDAKGGHYLRAAGDVAGAGGLGGFLTGGALSTAFEGVGAGARALRGKAATGIRMAEADQAAASAKAAQKAERAARGALGGESAAALNAYEQASKIAANTSGLYTSQQVQQAQALLADPKFHEVLRNAAQNVLDVGGDRLSGSLPTARAAYETAQAANTPQAIEAAADAAMQHPVKTQVLPRLKKYATRLIPTAIGSGVGAFTGHPIIGTVMGSGVGAVMGDPGTAFANMVKSPSARAGAWRLLEKGLELPADAESAALRTEALRNALRKRAAAGAAAPMPTQEDNTP